MACSYFSRQREAPYPHRKATDSEPGRQCWLIIKIDLKGRRRKKSSAELWVCWCEYLLAGLFHLTDGAVQKVCILNVLRDAGIWKATFQWKNKRTVPESKSHWAYFLFPLVVFFFSSDVADVRCCSDWLWNSSLKCLALSFSSLFWFSSLELKFFVSGSLSTHSLDPTCWHTSFRQMWTRGSSKQTVSKHNLDHMV